MGVITMKIFAVMLGPSGVGLFSLLRQTQQTAVVLGLLNGQMTIIQGVASRSGQERKAFVSTVFWTLLVSAFIVSLALMVGAGPIARWLTGRTGAATPSMIRGLVISIVCGIAFTFFMSVLNGHRIIGRAALIQFTNFLTVSALAYPVSLLVRGGNAFAMTWLLAAGAGAAALLGLLLARRQGVFDLEWPRFTRENRMAALGFLRMTGSMVISGFLGLWVPLEIRTLIVDVFGLPGAGIFDVAWTLSMTYVLVILTSFSSYYLPTLTQTTDHAERAELIATVFRVANVLMLPLVTAVIVMKPLVVSLLYSSEFKPSLEIIRWMLIGDYFKVLSWVFSFTMIAYADMRKFVWTELLWGGMALSSAAVSIKVFRSMEMIGIAFVAVYVSYFLYMAHYVHARHGFAWQKVVTRTFLTGVAIVLGASLHTWQDGHVRWIIALLWVTLACAGSWMFLTIDERRWAVLRMRHALPGALIR